MVYQWKEMEGLLPINITGVWYTCGVLDFFKKVGDMRTFMDVQCNMTDMDGVTIYVKKWRRMRKLGYRLWLYPEF